MAALLCELVEDPAARAKIQAALAQWHAPRAAEQIAEIMLAAIVAAGKGQPDDVTARGSGRCAGYMHEPAVIRRMTWRFHFKRPMKTGAKIAGELAGRVSLRDGYLP